MANPLPAVILGQSGGDDWYVSLQDAHYPDYFLDFGAVPTAFKNAGWTTFRVQMVKTDMTAQVAGFVIYHLDLSGYVSLLGEKTLQMWFHDVTSGITVAGPLLYYEP